MSSARLFAAVFLISGLVDTLAGAPAPLNVLTNRYDNSRTSANLQESTLSTLNVNVNQFGHLYNYAVDGSIYAQPLYVSNITISGAAHNVVYVATMNDKVYAFDADNAGSPLWSRDFTNSSGGVTPVPIVDLVGSNTLNIVGNVGVESTPVINPSTNTMYLVARTKENGSYVQRLHALDITTGAEQAGSPVTISASATGTAGDTVNGKLTFDPKKQNQRASLALTNGVVVISWASHEDDTPYHGWIMGYDAATLKQVGVLCTTPNGTEGGIWQSGRAPVIDSAGYVYYQTGNGDWDGLTEFGDSVLKLKVSSQGITVADWFTPDNQNQLNAGDIDLGSSGAMMIPGTNFLVGGGKESVLYLLNSTNLGHEAAGNKQIPQMVNVNGGEIKGGPAYWSGPAGSLVYLWAQSDVLKAYHFNGSTFDAGVYASGSVYSPGSPGGTLTVSANGSTAKSGIVWAELSTTQDTDHGTVPGILRAFDAQSLQELWNSEMSSSRDRLGTVVKYVPPMVANGKVYAATYDNVLSVYGLLPGVTTSPDFVLTGSTSATIAVGGTATYQMNAAALNGFSDTLTFSVSGLPGGATANFNPNSVSGSGNTTLQVATSSTTSTGTYPLTITATNGNIVHTLTVQLTLVAGGLPAAAVSIDFVGVGTPMQASEVAGVVAKANWNSAAGAASAQGLALLDENGNATGASVTWTSDNTWSTIITDVAGNARMMKGYLDTHNGNPSVVTVAGLPATASGYDVYVYVDGNNPGANRSGNYQISGSGVATTTILATDAAGKDFAGTFTAANGSVGNYVKFSIQSTGFTLTATPGAAGDGFPRAPINGIQIVPTPAPDFTLTGGASATVMAGGTATTPVSVAAVNGFAGAVALSVSGLPTGATGTFSPTSVSGSGNSTLQIAASSTAVAGTYPLTITATSGTITHTLSVQLTVSAATTAATTAVSIDFVGVGTPMQASEVAGVVAKANWNSAAGAVSAQGLALLDENGNATGASVTWTSDNTWDTIITDVAGNARMMKGYLDTHNGNPSVVTVAGLPVSVTGYDVYVYVDGNNPGANRSGNYQISGSGVTTTTILATDAAGKDFAGTFTAANGRVGNYVKFSIQSTGFTLTATPGAAGDGFPRAPINGIQIVPTPPVMPAPDFTLTGGTTATVTAGGTATASVSVAAVNGFAGAVALSVSGLPTGATGTFSPTSVSGSGNSTLQIAASSTTVAGTYPLTITAASGTIAHTLTVQLTVSAATTSTSTAVSIDFVGGGTPMQASEVAGVVAKANWNSAAGAASTQGLALLDENGNATGASVTWTSDNTWNTNITDAAGNARMMKGYLDTGKGNPSVVTVAGLPTSATGYDVYVYVDGNNPGANRSASYQISGAGLTTTALLATDAAGKDFASTFTAASGSVGNYVKFSIQSTGFTLTATPGPAGDGYPRAPINGIQIVPTPAAGS